MRPIAGHLRLLIARLSWHHAWRLGHLWMPVAIVWWWRHVAIHDLLAVATVWMVTGVHHHWLLRHRHWDRVLAHVWHSRAIHGLVWWSIVDGLWVDLVVEHATIVRHWLTEGMPNGITRSQRLCRLVQMTLLSLGWVVMSWHGHMELSRILVVLLLGAVHALLEVLLSIAHEWACLSFT